jgi:uncharacterized membrane protein YkvI
MMIVVGYGPFFNGLYMAVLFCAIFTTAVSNAFAFSEWLRARCRIDKKTLAALLCVAGTLAAHVGFSNLVGYAYPFFGFLGIFIVAVVILSRRRLTRGLD